MFDLTSESDYHLLVSLPVDYCIETGGFGEHKYGSGADGTFSLAH